MGILSARYRPECCRGSLDKLALPFEHNAIQFCINSLLAQAEAPK